MRFPLSDENLDTVFPFDLATNPFFAVRNFLNLKLNLNTTSATTHNHSSLYCLILPAALPVEFARRSQTYEMDTLTTHPSTAQQAKAFTSPASLSFPGGAGDLTPPSEKDGNTQANGTSGQTNGANGFVNGQQQQTQGGNAAPAGNGVTPTTPAATPGAGQTGVSGIVPTLQ